MNGVDTLTPEEKTEIGNNASEYASKYIFLYIFILQIIIYLFYFILLNFIIL